MTDDENKVETVEVTRYDFDVFKFPGIEKNLIMRVLLMNDRNRQEIEEVFKPPGDFQSADNMSKPEKQRESLRASDKTKKIIEEHIDANAKYALNVLVSKVIAQILELGEENIDTMEEVADHEKLDVMFNMVGWIHDYQDTRLSFAGTPVITADLIDITRKGLESVDVKITNEPRIMDFLEKFLRIFAIHLSLDSWDDNRNKKATWHNLVAPMLRTPNYENWFESKELILNLGKDMAEQKTTKKKKV